MSGVVIDVFVAFLFKSALRWLRFLKSSGWKRRAARVVDRTVLEPVMGCPSVKVRYKAAWEDGSADGCDEIPFFFDWSAKQYAQRFSHGLPVTIRVNPKKLGETRFFESDQTDRPRS